MARIKVNIPDKFLFRTEIKVRITDLNYGGHLGNDRALAFAHEARARFLDYYGYSEKDLMGVSLIMADAAVQFKAEAFAGDIIEVLVTPGDFSNKGFDLFFLMKDNISGKEIIRCKTGMVCFDYSNSKICPVPEGLLELWK